MGITISGENNNDRILASDGVLDSISGINAVGVVTATSFTGDLTGDVTGNLTGNVTGNINNSTLLLQTGGFERIRITGNNEIGIAGANYGTSGQVLTSGGSGNAVSWTTITGVTINNNANNRLITGSGTANTLEGEANLTFDGTYLNIGTTDNTPLAVGGISGALSTSARANISLKTGATDGAADTGSGLLFFNHAGTGLAFGGSLQVLKENGTSGNTASLMRFCTRPNGGSVTEALRITSSGRLGLNTDNPDTTFTIKSGGDAQMSLKNSSGTTKAYLGTDGVFGSASTDDLRIRSDSSNIIFGFSGTERLRITSDGRSLFNTTSTTNTDDFLTLKRPASGHSGISMTVDATTATGSYANAFIFTKSKGYYYNGLVFSSSEKHEGGIVGRTTGSGSNDPSIQVRVGGTGINASDTLAMNINHSGYVTKPAHPTFQARLINHTNATANPLVFDDVSVNVGSHYKTSGSDAGKFVVPIAGTYFFFWEAIKNSTTSVTRLYLQKNGSRLSNQMHLRLQEEGLYANGCLNVIMTLAVGDKIHIELAVGGVHASEYTHFGGYLIG